MVKTRTGDNNKEMIWQIPLAILVVIVVIVVYLNFAQKDRKRDYE